jgi:hypothetical protein
MAASGPRPVPIDQHAAGNLRYIRDAIERASDFTAVPGRGGALMGATAVGAAVLAHRTTGRSWLVIGWWKRSLPWRLGRYKEILGPSRG